MTGVRESRITILVALAEAAHSLADTVDSNPCHPHRSMWP
jgi:hypothetical protein